MGLWIAEQFEKLTDLIDDEIEVPILKGLVYLLLMVIILGIAWWIVYGLAVSPLMGGSFMWKSRGTLLLIWGIVELANSIGQ